MTETDRFVLTASIIIGGLVGGCRSAGTDSGIKPDASSSPATSPGDPSEAMVLIRTSGPVQDTRVGLGSVIGDGSLIVTAYHLVFETSENGVHTTPLLPVVISPYLGDVCYGRILAADRELDLAILQVPWLGHPGFQLLDDQGTYQLRDVVIYSPSMERSQDGSANINLAQIRTERLPVKSVVCRQGIPAEMRLAGCGRLTHGWSGAPILAEPGNLFAGCFTTVHQVTPTANVSLTPDKGALGPKWQESASGPASSWARKMIASSGSIEGLQVGGTREPRPPDANEAVEHVLRALGLSSPAKSSPEERAKEFDTFLLLRPTSISAMTYKALQLAKSAEPAAAEELFRQAVRQDPSNVHAVMAFGEFLETRQRAGEAMELYRRTRQLEPHDSCLDYAMARITSLNEPEDVALEKINNLISEHPDDRYLLAMRAQVYLRQNKRNEAVEMLKDVVRFMPEDGLYRRILADLLQRLGRFDEAETQLRDIITLRPNDPEAYLRLARFLAGRHPEAREKAAEMARQALALASQQGSDTTAIQKLLHDLENR
jgi:tetratricopeptide (TPR) repeat protein